MGLIITNVTRPFFPDTTSPTPPTLNAPSIAGSTVSLTWSPSTDSETGVVGYVVVMDGQPLPAIVRALGTDVSGVPNGAHTFAIRGRDGAGNLSVLSNTQNVQIGSVIIVGAINYNPGLYIYTDRNTNLKTQLARLSYFAARPVPRGQQLISFWSQWENPNVPGDYSGNWDASGYSGFTGMQKILDRHAQLSVQTGRHWGFMWHISTYGFFGVNQPTTFPDWLMPHYMSGGAYGPSNNTVNDGIVGGAFVNVAAKTAAPTNANVRGFVRWWTGPVMGRLIALAQAYGDQFGNHPNFEMVSFLGESAVNLYSGYSDSQGFAQMVGTGKYFDAVAKAWPKVQRRFWTNYLSDTSMYKTLMAAAVASNFTIGGPDCINEGLPFQTYGTSNSRTRAIPFNRTFRGINPNTVLIDSSYPDFRDKTAFVSEFEPDEMGPRTPGFGLPASGSGDWRDNIDQANMQHAAYITLFDNGFTGNNDKRTTTSPAGLHPDALDFMESVFLGTAVNGFNAGITMPPRAYPSNWPT